jgi:hypothetical protein
MDDETERYSQILAAILELRDSSKEKSKDSWDKAAIIGQVATAVVLGVVGFVVTSRLDTGQRKSAAAIADAQNTTATAIAQQQRASAADIQKLQDEVTTATASSQLQLQQDTFLGTYLGQIVSASGMQRAEYIDAMDVEFGPHFAVPLAVRLVKPHRYNSTICAGKVLYDEKTDIEEQQDEITRETADELLQRLSNTRGARAELDKISQSTVQPDAGIAAAYLGKRSTVQYRVTEIDDYAQVILNGKTLATYKFGEESPWVDISRQMAAGQMNSFYLMVGNIAEGSGARLQMRIGSYQYDRAVRTKNWELPGWMFDFGISIAVNKKGGARYNGDDIQNLNMPTQENCDGPV